MKVQTLLALTLVALSAQARSATADILQDTTAQTDTVRVTPYLSSTPVYALGNSTVLSADPIAMQTNAGLNILNTLRGHVPNFHIGPNVSPYSPGLRSDNSLMVIDGLPYAPGFSNFFNLNSFEYQSILAINSGNGATLYGGPGYNGAFFLQSKTGENHVRPAFDFNSSATVLSNEISGLFNEESTTGNQVVLTNAFAFSQDFGPVDTRVSYTYSHWPDDSAIPDTKKNYQNLRVNTGFKITPRFKGRLILDDFYNRSESGQKVTYAGQTYSSLTENVNKSLLGNLQLNYQITDWLSVSSQSSLGKVEQNEYQTNYSMGGMQTGGITDRRQDRRFANLYVALNKSLSDDFTFSAFAGYQYFRTETDERYRSLDHVNQGGAWSETSTTSTIGGLGLQFKNYLFTDVNFRKDLVSIYSDDNNGVPAYSINTSFIFSEAFAWQNSILSFGKLRFSAGKSEVALQQGYPREWFMGRPLSGYFNPNLHASTKRMFESGIDLAFLKKRLTLNATLFSDTHKEMVGEIAVPIGTGATGFLTANLWDLRSRGWELMLGGTALRNDNASVTTSLIWATSHSELDSDFGIDPGEDEELGIGSPNPDWTGSFLTQVTFHNFFASLLIDGRKGGDILTRDFVNGIPGYKFEDGSMARLRDLSIGCRMSLSALEKLGMRDAQISLSGRNFWTMYSKTENDTENSMGPAAQKSATISLTLMF